MCGIFFSISASSEPVLPSDECKHALENRGPDSSQVQIRTVQKHQEELQLTFFSTVLSLRGDRVHRQPLVDGQSVLCWNGEAWKIAGEAVQEHDNDTELVLRLFLGAISSSSSSFFDDDDDDASAASAVQRFAEAVGTLSGPFSFVFYDAFHSILFFGRDCLGRRSLLHGFDQVGNPTICSVFCDGDLHEVSTDGLHFIDLRENDNVHTIPWTRSEEISSSSSGIFLVRGVSPFPVQQLRSDDLVLCRKAQSLE